MSSKTRMHAALKRKPVDRVSIYPDTGLVLSCEGVGFLGYVAEQLRLSKRDLIRSGAL